MTVCCAYESPIGMLTVAASDDAVVGLWMAGQRHFGAGYDPVTGDNDVLRRALLWLDRYFAGDRPDPEELTLAPHGSAFRLAVWQELRKIPYGETVSYADVSRRLQGRGIRACPQAVGGAVGRNPISIIIPCHRVIGKAGSLTGYAGGVEKKAFLLEHEQK